MAVPNDATDMSRNESSQLNVSTTDTEEGDEGYNHSPLITALSVVVQTVAQHGLFVSALVDVMDAISNETAEICLIALDIKDDLGNYIYSSCLKHDIKVLRVPDPKMLGEWCGMEEAKFIAIKDFSLKTKELEHVLQHLEEHSVTTHDSPALVDEFFVDKLVNYIPHAVVAMVVGAMILGVVYYSLPTESQRLAAYLICFSLLVVLIFVFFGCHFFFGRSRLGRRRRRSD